MPQSLDMAVFVFGAVLILLSLVVGSFKIFGAEVQGTVGRLGRVIAFLLGLILITTRLPRQPVPVPSPASPATTPAPVNQAGVIPAAPHDDPPADPTAGSLPPEPVPVKESFHDLVVGTWEGHLVAPDGSVTARIRYDRNGTFMGREIVVVANGVRAEQPVQGTWRVQPLSASRFKFTTRGAGDPGVESHTIHVLDHDSVENEDLGYVAHRVAGPP